MTTVAPSQPSHPTSAPLRDRSPYEEQDFVASIALRDQVLEHVRPLHQPGGQLHLAQALLDAALATIAQIYPLKMSDADRTALAQRHPGLPSHSSVDPQGIEEAHWMIHRTLLTMYDAFPAADLSAYRNRPVPDHLDQTREMVGALIDTLVAASDDPPQSLKWILLAAVCHVNDKQLLSPWQTSKVLLEVQRLNAVDYIPPRPTTN